MHPPRGPAGQRATACQAQALLQARCPAADILSLQHWLTGEVEWWPHGAGAGAGLARPHSSSSPLCSSPPPSATAESALHRMELRQGAAWRIYPKKVPLLCACVLEPVLPSSRSGRWCGWAGCYAQPLPPLLLLSLALESVTSMPECPAKATQSPLCSMALT